jgi:hypothetical protein
VASLDPDHSSTGPRARILKNIGRFFQRTRLLKLNAEQASHLAASLK